MSESIVPAAVKLAARRAFVRTTYQAYAATLSAALLASVISLIVDQSNWVTVIVSVVTAIASPPLAGLASYLNMTSKGIPGDYAEAVYQEDLAHEVTEGVGY